MIKTVIFDADGVIINKPKLFSQILEEEYNVPTSEFIAFYKAEFDACLRGKADLKQLLPKYLHEWGVELSAEEFLQVWFKKEHYIDENVVTSIKTLRQRGISCFIATNQEMHRTEYMKKEMGLASIVSEVFSSAYIGYKKPEAMFYEKVVETIGLPKEEILFWDDDKENIEGALKYGLQAEIYTSFEKYSHKIQVLL